MRECAALEELPERDGDDEPDGARGEQGEPRAVVREHTPEDESESGEADAAECGPGGVEAGSHAAADGSVMADGGFALPGVGFDEGGGGGEDGGKGEEETAGAGTEVFGDKGREHGSGSAEGEAHEVFGRLVLLERGELGFDQSQYLPLRSSQEPMEMANQTGMSATVASRALGL